MTHTTKHTPGPWYPHYAKADHCLSSSVWGQEPGNQVAVIGGKSLEAMNANARLIAAAPAMYEALKELVAYLQDHVADEVLDNWAPVLKAACALAQAEGSKP